MRHSEAWRGAVGAGAKHDCELPLDYPKRRFPSSATHFKQWVAEKVTWRCGHLLMPRRRQSFLNAVVHMPSFCATVCRGRWKCSRSDCPVTATFWRLCPASPSPDTPPPAPPCAPRSTIAPVLSSTRSITPCELVDAPLSFCSRWFQSTKIGIRLLEIWHGSLNGCAFVCR